MRSIYERTLGADFNRLHPRVRERFGFDSTAGRACIGKGVMETLWHGAVYTLPFLYLGTWRRIMFPERGTDVPFTIRNYAYLDSYGRETVSWIRSFETARPRRFDAYMIYSEDRNGIVDYLGTHQHLAVDLALSVTPEGGLRLVSGEQRFYEGPVSFRFPSLFTGTADVTEWWDEPRRQYGIEVKVTNQVWGPLFGYRGFFDAVWVEGESVPVDIRPVREERRE